jgi:hypothetical protein|tara:strand:+ start:108 stop:299 length:192 start_codon:yes stop_codon:yes gene_type:complete
LKYVIILLLSVSGVEEIKFETHGLDCGELAKAWREVNTTYHGTKADQGNYTSDGKLMMGYLCE